LVAKIEKNELKEKVIRAKEALGESAAHIIAQDLSIEDFDEVNLKATCPFHSEDTPSFIWNHKNNSFKCFGCGKVYGIVDHYMSFHNQTFLGAVELLFSETNIQHSFGEKGVQTMRNYNYPQYEASEDRTEVEKYFAMRKISKETLDYCDVKQDKHGNVMWNFFNENDVLVTVKTRHSRKPKRNEQKEWYLKDYDNKPILYNMNKIDPTQPLIITEGQIDCLTVIEAGYKNVVSVPGGTENLKWVEECFDWLEGFDKIILWFDNDAPGLKSRKEAVARLGTWRTLVVDIPDIKHEGKTVRFKDANEVLFFTGDLQLIVDMISSAREMPIAGVINLGDVEDFDISKASGLFSSVDPLKRMLYKYVFGSVAIITGKRGSGKSSFANQEFVSASLEQGYDTFVFSGEIKASILKSWIEINMLGREHVTMIDEFNRKVNPNAKKKMREWYDKRIWIYDTSSNKEAEVFEKAIAVTRKYGVKVWVLDNLSILDLDEGDNNELRKQKEFIVKCVNYAALYDVLIVLVVHPRKTAIHQKDLVADDVGGTGALTNLAQYVLTVHRFTDEEKKGTPSGRIGGGFKKGCEPIEFDVSIEVLKNRYTGKLGKAFLYFSYPDYRFFSTLKELYKRLKWNTDNTPLPTVDPRDENQPFQKGIEIS